ncbi:2Fe-2S iron-sulfur cluster binding domain-containing protein [uncultured Microbulbifer sp.]|uniref:2Fe-2S iron-sulfur cluster-binding protein n=1 Tax=uncultured Microbulbifer sp. TaxID=348147 RepID=UPI002622E7FC|nr:2Fe-2S iron-sulfur cluster binding domain-containing protein [uncultured Microbulbifer sp.]
MEAEALLSDREAEDDLVRLRVTINGRRHEGEGSKKLTILENIEKMRLPIRSSCRRGRCGSCRVRVLSGELRDNGVRLNEDVLSCSSYLAGDGDILLPY